MSEDGEWLCPHNGGYQATMVAFMCFFHGGMECEDTHEFTRDELLDIEPTNVKRYLLMKAHNDPFPDIPGGDRPVHGRSDSLHHHKKELSFFMPHKNTPWVDGKGDPTKSQIVNDMIKLVKKFEVHGEGAASHAKRPLKQTEFRKTLEPFNRETDWNHQRKCPMMVMWQCHSFRRVDDVANFKVSDPRGH